MTGTRLLLASIFLALGLVAACQTDANEVDYTDFPVPEPLDTFPTISPDPYMQGDERLEVGIFYGGGSSEAIGLTGMRREYFIFDASYEQATVDDRIEGRESDEITLNGTPFWGGGIIWMDPIDISKWTLLNVAFKSSDPSFATFDLTLQSGEADEEADGVALRVTDYGYRNDGEWHFLQIPLQDAVDAGWDPRVARSPFIIGAGGGTQGDVLLIDNLYFTRDLDDLELGTGGAGGSGE